MSSIELFELSWYIRDHLFRRYNKEGSEIIADNIPLELINTYFRYRENNIEHLRELLKTVLAKLQESSVLVQSEDFKLKMNAILNRFQCSKCKYISYLTKLEPMVCFRCGSEELNEFLSKKNWYFI